MRKLEVNPDIFKTVPHIDMGEQLILTGLYLGNLEKEQEYYLKLSSYEELQKFISGAYVESIEESKEKIKGYMVRFVLRRGILYCIRIK